MASQVSYEYLTQALATQVNTTTTSVSAINTAGTTIAVILGGTAVPLPTRPYNNGFTVNGGNTIYTVQNTGNYLISYDINTTVGLLLSSSVYINGSANSNLTRSPGVSASAYSAQAIIPLVAGDTIQLTLFGLIGSAVLQSGQGAVMNVVKIS